METSVETLIVGGTLALLVGFLLGVSMARARMAGPEAPRHLVNAHLDGLIGGAALLGLSLAAGYSNLPGWLEVTAAWLLVGGLAGSLAGGILNWLGGVDDQFAARSAGFGLQSVAGPSVLAGGLILAYGVVEAAL